MPLPGAAWEGLPGGGLVMDRQLASSAFAVALLVGLLVAVATFDVGYGLAAFMVALLGVGGYEAFFGRQARS